MKTTIVCLLSFLLSGCNSWAPEVPVAATLLQQSIEANKATRKIMFDAMTKNMEKMLDAQLEFDLALRIERSKSESGTFTEQEVRNLISAHNAIRASFKADIEAEEVKWLNDPNLEISEKLSKSLNGYLGSIDTSIKSVQLLINQAKGL